MRKILGSIIKRLTTNPAYFEAEGGGNANPRSSLLNERNTPTEVLKVDADTGLRAYNVSPEVFTAVQLVCNTIATTPITFEYRPRTRTEFKELASSSFVRRLIEHPNRKLTKFEMIWRIMAYKYLCGRAYVSLEESKGKQYLFVLDPRYVKPVPNDDEVGVSGYIFSLPGEKPIFIPNKFMFVIEEFNPLDHWYGMSRIAPLVADITARYNSIKNFGTTEGRGGAGFAVLSHDVTSMQEFDEEQIKRLKREYNQRGIDSSRLLVLEKGQNFDLITKDSGSVNREAILNINQQSVFNTFMIPYSLFNPKVNNEWDKATKFFYTFGILPELEVLAQRLSDFFNNLIEDIEYRITFDTKEIDELKLYALNETRVDVAEFQSGLTTADQIRHRRGDPLYADDPDEMVRDYGRLPKPVFEAKYGKSTTGTTDASPSASLPGSLGGRDQSANGEAQMVDTTGQKNLLNDD